MNKDPSIIFLCPPAGKINGGIKYIFRHAEALAGLGHPAAVYEQSRNRPMWFASTAPIVSDEALANPVGKILVIPEDQLDVLKSVLEWPCKKIIYAQNQYYAALGVGGAESYASWGVSTIICASQTVKRYCDVRHKGIPNYLVPCGIDRHLFAAKPKLNQIAYIPRKRPLEARFIQDLFIHLFPHWKNWQWKAIDQATERDTAYALGDSKVFLSLSRLDGLGLTPLEAMSAGCVVAGFTGIGGREYATQDNGFWAEEDNPEDCVQKLGAAMALLEAGKEPLGNYLHHAALTVANYTPQVFTDAVKATWTQILKEQAAA